MRHHALVAALGILLAAALVPGSIAQAASADPTGYWRKAEQGERPGKFQISRCGSGNKLLCAKIVWLENPLDSNGRPLHDVRNENPSMRDRPIMGLPIFSGLQPVGPNVWKGNIYNPEDGGTYSVTVTQVSRNQINVKGCKAWLLCGERVWVRTNAPTPPKEEVAPTEQVEASAQPEATKPEAAEPATDVAAAEAPKEEENALANAEVLTPAVQDPAQPGYRFLNASASAQTPAGFSGENVPSMFAMTKPVAPQSPATEETTAPQAETAAAPAPAPATQTAAATPKPAPAPAAQTAAATPKAASQPTPQPIQASVAAPPRPQAAPVAPAPNAAPPAGSEAAAVEASETETAEAAALEEPPLSRRERRLLRRQQKQTGGLLPWLQ